MKLRLVWQDFLMAALAMQQAVEHDSKEPKWLQERDRLLLLIPDQPATILQVKGALYLESLRRDPTLGCP